MPSRSTWLTTGLALLISACAAFPMFTQKSAKERECRSSIELIERADELVRASRTLRHVSTTCGNRDQCISALSARACELHADGVVLEGYRMLRDQQYQPAYLSDPKRVQSGDAPQQVPAPGPPAQFVAQGRLIVWTD